MTTPAYSLLQLDCPTQRSLPRAQLDKRKRFDHDKSLKRLANAQKVFTKKAFWIDVAILDRMYYKLINSQRMFPRFRIMSQARQITKRLKTLAIDKVIAEFYQTFWNAKSMEKCKGEWKFAPTREFAQYTMHRIIATALLLDKLQASLMQTFCEYSKSLAKAHFVSMVLTMMAICSRLCRIAHIWVTELEQCYKLLYTWHKSLPLATSTNSQQQEQDTVDFSCNADTFQKARQITMKSWSGHESIPGISLEEMKTIISQHSTPQAASHSMNVDNDELDLGEVIERD